MLIFKQIIVKDTLPSAEQSKVTADRGILRETLGGRIQELSGLDSFLGEKLACAHDSYDHREPAFEETIRPSFFF